MVIFDGDDVDFVKESLVISGNNSVILGREIAGNGGFGLLTEIGGVFLGGFAWIMG